jgi:hypothetical protein
MRNTLKLARWCIPALLALAACSEGRNRQQPPRGADSNVATAPLPAIATAPATLTSPAHLQAWRVLFTLTNGIRVAVDTTTEVHDGAGMGMAEFRFERPSDDRLEDSILTRTSVERWMLDCEGRRYKWVGAEYYDSTGSLVHRISNDSRIKYLSWESTNPRSEGGLTVAEGCKVIRARPITSFPPP